MLPEKRIKERRPKTAEQALASLMHLCARAEKSSGDALRLMRTWSVPEAARQGVLQKLLDQRFIDDARYAGAFVREKTRLSGWGTLKIRAALQRKGIARPVVDAALAEADPAETTGRLLAKLTTKVRTVKYTTPYELKNKLMRYGLSLGYEYETVLEAVARFVKSSDETCDDF